MPNNKPATLLTWWLWSPLKFAFTTLTAMCLVTLVYGLITGYVFNTGLIPRTPLLVILALVFGLCIAYQVRKLPNTKMDRPSFIAIHNIQTFVASVAFILSTIILVANAQTFMLYLLWMETKSNITFVMIMILVALFYLYLMGIFIANVYAKIQRAREMGIPLWKIIFSMPFGFSMIWTPGYLLPDPAPKTISQPIQTQWYKKLTDWILSCPVYTIGTFTVITTLSGYFFGFKSILLTFALALVFGIWAIQVGTKNLAKNIGHRFASVAIIINLVMIICVIGFRLLTTPITQDVQITISDTQEITQSQDQ